MTEGGEMDVARIADSCAFFISNNSRQTTPEILDICSDFARAVVASGFGAGGWVDWLTSGGPTPFVLLISFTLAWLGYRTTKKDTRLRATLDTLSKSQSTEVYRSGHETFNHYAGHDPRALGCLTNKNFSRHQRLAVITHLNNYEEIAGSYYQGILDKTYIQRLLKGLILETWHKGVFFIFQHRWRRDANGGELLKYKVKTSSDGCPVGENGEPLTFDAQDTNQFIPLNGSFVFLDKDGNPGQFQYQEKGKSSYKHPALDPEKGKPSYYHPPFIELEKLANEFGAEPKLFPDKDGKWILSENDIENLEALRIRKPAKPVKGTNEKEEDFNSRDDLYSEAVARFKELRSDLVKMTRPIDPYELKEISKKSAYYNDGVEERFVLDPHVRIRDWAPETIEQRLAEINEAVKGFLAKENGGDLKLTSQPRKTD